MQKALAIAQRIMHNGRMRTHSDIVKAIGAAELAELTGAPLPTVYSWSQRNSIPAEHWPVFVKDGAATLEELAAGVKPRERKSPDDARAAA